MNVNLSQYLSVAVFMTTVFLCTTVNAQKPAACAGVEKVCTKNKTYDKTIEGKEYSCYDCKQTLCSGGGNSIVGSQSSSVCSEKSSKIIKDGELHSVGDVYIAPPPTNNGPTRAPARAVKPMNKSIVVPTKKTKVRPVASQSKLKTKRVPAIQPKQPTGTTSKFDEADAIFGKRSD